jgi:hypothetical protein
MCNDDVSHTHTRCDLFLIDLNKYEFMFSIVALRLEATQLQESLQMRREKFFVS